MSKWDVTGTSDHIAAEEAATLNAIHPGALTQSRWASYVTVASGLFLLIAVLIYAVPGSPAVAADWQRPDSALAQGWLHVALALAFLAVAPLPSLIRHTWQKPHGAIDRVACPAGHTGCLIFALIMAVQADGWFQASAVSASTPADVRAAVASAIYYNSHVLGGLAEFVALVLVGVWFAWVGIRAGSLPSVMRVACLMAAILLVTGLFASFMAVPLVATFLGVWLVRTAL